ncbi:MAG: hypothetical protein OXF44_05605 [Anaerolineaceae bacterium]|nr:hypothetical protein [Anaerolineaceae bacterium]MCY4023604.1 hypothetical protein [Anaerolineaceae bacterium]
MDLRTLHQSQGAHFAPDGIPLHFGDPQGAWQAALQSAVLLDRSHEARLRLSGASAADLLQRLSTNDVLAPGLNQGCPTIFTSWHGRVLERVEVWREPEGLLLLGGPGRTVPLRDYLQRNIFFNDDVQITDLAPDLILFDLIGPAAPALLQVPQACRNSCTLSRAELAGHALRVAPRKAPGVPRLSLLAPVAAAVELWQALCDAGALPAGSLLFNALRVRAGLPAAGSELTTDFIPLELGLWDEVSFSKGCYTGQEIIARMESRGQLAKMMMRLRPAAAVEAPAELLHEGRVAGRLTSSITAPDGVRHALGVLRRAQALPGTLLQTAAGVRLEVLAPAGVQPAD